jgi:uncharacterized protein
MAFVGNKALGDLIRDKLQAQSETVAKDKLIPELQKYGLFEPDHLKFPKHDIRSPFLPVHCILMLTTGCNLSCTYCYAEYTGKKKVTMEWAIAQKAIEIAFENAKNKREDRFSLSFHGGGEPTMYGDLLIKAAEYAKKLDPDCPVSVTTNAVWNREFRKKALGLLNEVSISLDGGEVTQNRQRPDKRGNGTFLRAMETIREIEKRNIPYGIRMTVTRESLPELKSNIEFLCRHTQCNTFQIEAVYNMGKATDSGLTIENADAFTRQFMEAHHLARECGKSVYFSSARLHLITDTFCTATNDALIVTSDGELTACYEVFDHSHVLSGDFIIGKIDVKEGIIFYRGKRELLQRKILENKNKCRNCFCYFHCAGDCPPKSITARRNGDKFRCTVTKAVTREMIIDRIIENNGFWH